MRTWDKRAEAGYMKEIEDDFQELASRIIEEKFSRIDDTSKQKVDRFFALWNMRATCRDKELVDIKLNGITGEMFTRDQEERFENVAVLFVRQGGTMPAHRFQGVQIQTGIMRQTAALANIRWGIVRAREAQFLVPDFPVTTFVPIDPGFCLCGTSGELVESGTALRNTVVGINHHLAAPVRNTISHTICKLASSKAHPPSLSSKSPRVMNRLNADVIPKSDAVSRMRDRTNVAVLQNYKADTLRIRRAVSEHGAMPCSVAVEFQYLRLRRP
jgi:hypothetical protein